MPLEVIYVVRHGVRFLTYSSGNEAEGLAPMSRYPCDVFTSSLMLDLFKKPSPLDSRLKHKLTFS